MKKKVNISNVKPNLTPLESSKMTYEALKEKYHLSDGGLSDQEVFNNRSAYGKNEISDKKPYKALMNSPLSSRHGK